jgi:hypothetical protein
MMLMNKIMSCKKDKSMLKWKWKKEMLDLSNWKNKLKKFMEAYTPLA